MSDNIFELINVKYKDILDIEKLSIEENKVTCIIGTSGSGKTTLLKLLNKMVSADSGKILYKAHPVDSIDSVEMRRKVVMLPQIPVVFKGCIRDNLLIGLKYSDKDAVSDEKLIEIMKVVNLDKELDENPEKLSGGERQRLAIGRVILMNPEVLLLDEPSSALDDDTEELVISAIVNYARNNDKTIIVVTHSRKIAERFSDETIEIFKNDKNKKRWYDNE